MIRYHRKGHAHADGAAGHVVISYLAALLAAVTNATFNALNRKAARDVPGLARLRFRLTADLLHRRAWLAAVGLMFLSFVSSAVALGTGQLAAVQLLENAYHAGPLSAAQPGITLADPLAATTWGVPG